MKILVTGAKGFIGKNLVAELYNRGYEELYLCDIETTDSQLETYCEDCKFVFNLAGINRPKNSEEFMQGNFCFATKLMNALKIKNNKCPIMNASSVQALLDNPYGKSKKAGEDALQLFGEETGASIYTYRFQNVFGKWGKPNYNSVIATFCYNITRNLPIQVNDENVSLTFVYIDDILEELIACLRGNANLAEDGFCYVPCVHETTLEEIVKLLYSFKDSRTSLTLPNLKADSFEKKLYSTYLSYLPKDKFIYPLEMHIDERGSFTEMIRTEINGQFSVNISKPGVVKGNHWHHTKNEKFIVVSGTALFQFRQYGENEIIEYRVSSKKMEVVDIPPGYTHNIINEGDTDLVIFIWSNECFDKNMPDTIFEEVKKYE